MKQLGLFDRPAPVAPKPDPFTPTREAFSGPARWTDEPRGDATALELTWRRRSLEEWARVDAQRERAAVVEQLAAPAVILRVAESTPAHWTDEPLADEPCEECGGRGRWPGELGQIECWRCYGTGLERPTPAGLRAAATPAHAASSCTPEVARNPAPNSLPDPLPVTEPADCYQPARPCVLCREPTGGLTPDGRAPMCPGCRRRVEPQRRT